MSRMMLVIPLMAVAMAGSVLPVLSGESDSADKKDLCVLIAVECGHSVQSIQDKIDRLKEEISKGTAVYTPEELRSLKQKLDDVNKTLDMLGNKPPYVDESH